MSTPVKEETLERVRYMRIDTMTWPTVDNDLAWRLRYSQDSISAKDKFYLASLVSAYSELINCGREKRETICRAIRGRTEVRDVWRKRTTDSRL